MSSLYQILLYRSCPDKEGALSVMRLPINNDTLQELITTSLSQYCVKDTSQGTNYIDSTL